MRKVLFAAVLIISNQLIAQVGTPQKVAPEKTVGKISTVGTFIAELTYSENQEEKDTTYTLRFRNYAFRRITDIRSIQFSGIGGAADELYKMMKAVFSEENKSNKDYAVDVTVGEKLIQIGNHREMGTTMVRFITGENSYGLLTERQVDKLFGK